MISIILPLLFIRNTLGLVLASFTWGGETTPANVSFPTHMNFGFSILHVRRRYNPYKCPRPRDTTPTNVPSPTHLKTLRRIFYVGPLVKHSSNLMHNYQPLTNHHYMREISQHYTLNSISICMCWRIFWWSHLKEVNCKNQKISSPRTTMGNRDMVLQEERVDRFWM